MKIRKKLLLAFVGLALFVGLVGSLAIDSLKKITEHVTQIRKSSILELQSSTEMSYELIKIEALRKEFIYEANDNHAVEIAIIKRKLEESFTGFENALNLRKGITVGGLSLYEAEELTEEEEEVEEIQRLENKYKEYKYDIIEHINVYEERGTVLKYALHTHKDSTLTEEVRLFKEDSQEEITGEIAQVVNEASSSTNALLLISVFSLIIAVLAGIFISKSIATPILKLKEATQNIALGHMDIIQDTRMGGEMGDLAVSFNMMTTDLQASRLQIEEHNKTLEQKVQERTRELEENILKLKQTDEKLIEQANDLKNSNLQLEQFAFVASHDLQEPLRTSSNIVELFQKQYKGKLDAKADQYLLYIMQASDRMKSLIGDLLQYSRIGTKKELQEVDTNLVLQEVLTDLGAAITEAGAEISSEQLPVISGYRTEMKLLFQNLIINAIKFRKKNTCPRIRIHSEIKNGSWEFAVSDNGIGIEQKHSEKIFAIFQRLHTRNEYEGSGIGLSNCRKIVELHKGKIWVESTVGTGSTFHFTIHKNNN